MADSSKLPIEFLNLMVKVIGRESINTFLDALNEEPVVAVRLNPNKNSQIPSINKVPWCSSGFYLSERPSFTLDPLFHAGAYYVQEPSSMFLEQMIRSYFKESDEIKALDLCAAPGGKSTHLLSLLGKGSLLVSNEVIRSRANILSENIQKWGNANVMVTQNDPNDFRSLKDYFDLIVVDAPCSGEGLFRKDHDAMKEWSLNNVQHCSQRQKRILTDILPSLSNNGLLIYCTCTYNPMENEENLKWLKDQADIEFLRIPEAETWGIEEVNSNGIIGYRFLPHCIRGEGFFMSGFIKRGDRINAVPKQKHAVRPNSSLHESMSSFIKDSNQFHFISSNKSIQFFPAKWNQDIIRLTNLLRCVHVGTTTGIKLGKKFVPEQALALSNDLIKEAWFQIELNKEDALRYLRKELFNTVGTRKGYALVTHQNVGLGWINQLDNRYNNLYPTHWRIKMKSN